MQALRDCWSPASSSVSPVKPPRRLSPTSESPPQHTLTEFTQEQREQALRDYKVTIEYKHLKSHAPGGVYLLPNDSLRSFCGVIFVRRGPFTNGIFQFTLQLPPNYNERDAHPVIVFTSHVFNPHVDPTTGQLDLQTAYPTWDPSRHYLVTVLTFLKKIFYAKSFDDAQANLDAKELATSNPDEYHRQVEACVRTSQQQVFVHSDGVPFSEEELSHRVLRDLLKSNLQGSEQVNKHALLGMIEKASKV